MSEKSLKEAEYVSADFKDKFDMFPQVLAECLGNGTLACKKVGITYQTYQKWKRNVPGFAERCGVAEETAGDFVENSLFKLIRDGHSAAIMFYCRTKLKHRGYGTDANVTNSSVTKDIKSISEADKEILDRYVNMRIAEMKEIEHKTIEVGNEQTQEAAN